MVKRILSGQIMGNINCRLEPLLQKSTFIHITMWLVCVFETCLLEKIKNGKGSISSIGPHELKVGLINGKWCCKTMLWDDGRKSLVWNQRLSSAQSGTNQPLWNQKLFFPEATGYLQTTWEFGTPCMHANVLASVSMSIFVNLSCRKMYT